MKPSKPSLRLSEMRGPEIEISLRSFNLFDNFFTEFGAGADDFQAEIVEGELAASDKGRLPKKNNYKLGLLAQPLLTPTYLRNLGPLNRYIFLSI